MIRIPNLALLALLPATAFAQQPREQQQQQPDPKAAWQQFLATNGPAWAASWNRATGTPQAIYGEGLALGQAVETMEEAIGHGAALLQKHAALLGTGPSKFVLLDSSQIRHLYYLVYGQRFHGLEVRGGHADVRIHVNGTVSMFGATAVRIPQGFNTNSAINAVAARAIAETEILGRAGKAGRQTRLVIWAQPQAKAPTRPVLAWEVEINEIPDRVVAGKAWVDAATGAFLEFENAVIDCGSCGRIHTPELACADRTSHALASRALASRKALEGTRGKPAAGAPKSAANPDHPPVAITGTVMAWTNTGHRPTDALKNVPLPNLFVTSSAGNATTDAQGKFSIPYTGTANVTVTATLGGLHTKRIAVSSGTQMQASASISPTTAGTIQFGTQNMGDLDKSQTTAYYFTDDVNRYVRSLVPNKPSQFATLDGMAPRVNINASCNAYYTGYTINFYNSSTTCNMTAYETVIQHEWGHGLDDSFGGIVFTDGLSEGWADVICILRSQQADVGPGFYKNQTPDWVRNANNTRKYPAGGGTHQQGEVWMGWVWDVRKDIASRQGVPAAQLITEGIVIPTIVANAQNLEKQVLEVFLLDDDDGNLANGTPHYIALEKASLNRNVKFPKIEIGSLSHTALEGSTQQLTPQIVRAIAKPNLGSFTKVELTYDVGAGKVTREMVPSGKTDEYVALIPGVLSPKEVKYSILATHSTSKTLRVPVTGENSYAIGQENVLFSDDFEGTNKWSSGALSGFKNDFALGAPTGASGESWGTKWADPKGAYGGSRCWGNNLGGAYAGSMSAFLRSPKLDFTGKTNVRLRLQRWLTVQGGFDKAQITLNGSAVWENPILTDILDTAWTKVDMRLAGADNNGGVQIDFRMLTDGGKELGGWNIDDVVLYSFQALPPPKLSLQITPAMIGLGKSSAVAVQGTPSVAALILVSASPGPTNIPGLPALHVGVPFVVFPAGLNSSGQMNFNFSAPSSSSATGLLTYVQVLEQTNASTVTASNAGVVLFGK